MRVKKKFEYDIIIPWTKQKSSWYYFYMEIILESGKKLGTLLYHGTFAAP